MYLSFFNETSSFYTYHQSEKDYEIKISLIEK